MTACSEFSLESKGPIMTCHHMNLDSLPDSIQDPQDNLGEPNHSSYSTAWDDLPSPSCVSLRLADAVATASPLHVSCVTQQRDDNADRGWL